MDDLLALFDAAVADTADPSENEPFVPNISPDSITSKPPPNKSRRNVPPTHKRTTTTASVKENNDLYGIRTINRKISSIDLMHRMIDDPFHGVGQLCAASLSTLNTLLVEPTTIVDVATVNGKTHLWTLGIVFTNSGSRIGPSGKAYCMLTIGTFTTGPAITILLFGNSYLTYCRAVRPGMVIALINPRLLSPRTTDRTSSSSSTTILTFSITDNEQLLVVGDAQDYGRCKATTSSKNEYGQWIPNSKACHHYVDKRQGDYCTQHRKQQHNHKNSSISSNNNVIIPLSGKTTSSMQQLRAQAAAFPTTGVRTTNMLLSDQTNRTRSTAINTKPPNRIVAMNHRPSAMPHERENQKSQPLQAVQKRYTLLQSKNPLLADSRASNMSENPQLRGSAPIPAPTIPKKPLNPYSLNQREPLHSKKELQRLEPPLVTRNALSSIDILQQPQLKRPTNGVAVATKEIKKRRLVNTDTSGFNGSVPVPVPAKIFSRTNEGSNHNVVFPGQSQTQRKNDERRRTENVIVQQQMIASQLQACQKVLVLKGRSDVLLPKKSQEVPSKPKSMKERLKDDLFGSVLDGNERENIIKAKSHFVSEVEAEEYARSRRVICELEEQESKVIVQANVKNPDGKTPVIQKEWYCTVCKKQFNREPMRCLRLQHVLKVERTLRATKSKGEERLAMTEAKTEDGGLVLGTGLDWSRFPNTPSSRFS